MMNARTDLIRLLTVGLIGLVVTICMTGCGGYVLYGKVIEGDYNALEIVDVDDMRLDQPGVPGASVRIINDPQSLGREELGVVMSNSEGVFRKTIDLPLAGVAIYDLGFVVRAPGYAQTMAEHQLPPKDKWVLIIIKRGRDTYTEPENLIEESRSYR
jgi:hypothetical protein